MCQMISDYILNILRKYFKPLNFVKHYEECWFKKKNFNRQLTQLGLGWKHWVVFFWYDFKLCSAILICPMYYHPEAKSVTQVVPISLFLRSTPVSMVALQTLVFRSCLPAVFDLESLQMLHAFYSGLMASVGQKG
jgi:hypothetical protein